MIAGVLSELFVDQVEVALDQANREGTDATNVRVLLQQKEQLEQRRRLVNEDLVGDSLQKAVLDLEMGVQGLRRSARIHQERLLELLQQHLVQPGQVHDRTVVTLHELFDGKRVRRILVSEHARELHLVIEQ